MWRDFQEEVECASFSSERGRAASDSNAAISAVSGSVCDSASHLFVRVLGVMAAVCGDEDARCVEVGAILRVLVVVIPCACVVMCKKFLGGGVFDGLLYSVCAVLFVEYGPGRG